MKKSKKIWLTVMLLLLILSGLDQRMQIRRYTLESEKITSPVRIALITDLHSCRYGTNQETLLNAVSEQNPDMIAFAGDIFDDQMPDENTEITIAGLAENYPCCYVTGNHEGWCTKEKFLQNMQFLKDHHVRILSGTSETMLLNGQKLYLCGADDPDCAAYSENQNPPEQQMQYLSSTIPDGVYAVLLSHRPELFPEYQNLDFDLILCGHAHGGQWRIPVILNGLYAPNQGLFPEYAGGMYQENQVIMIVSRGLARESTRIPRFYNRPELVIIDLQ